jgi:hypothetical protein
MSFPVKANQLLAKSKYFYKQATTENIISNIRFGLEHLLNGNYSPETIENWLKKNEFKFPDSIDNVFSNNLEKKRTAFIQMKYKKDDAVISKNRLGSEYDKFKIKYSALLEGVENIPTLYFYVLGNLDVPYNIKNTGAYSVVKDDPSLMFYDFILKGIKHIGANESKFEEIHYLAAIEFLKKNKSKIDNVISMFKTLPKFLGQGSDGVAFSVGPNLIFKMFSKQFTYEAAQKAMERLHSTPEIGRTESMIYDIGILGNLIIDEDENNDKSIPIYYYIQEKMETIAPNSEYRDKLQNLVDIIKPACINSIKIIKATWAKHENLLQSLSKKDKIDYFNGIINEQVRNIVDNILETQNLDELDVQKLQPDWLEKFVEEMLMKTLTNRYDLHVGNIGITNQGYLRYFDSAFPVGIPALEKAV